MSLPFSTELKRSELDRKKRPLEITEQQVSYDGKRISCNDVTGVRYGSMRIEGGIGKLGGADIHEFRLLDNQGNQLRVTFSASFGKSRKEQAGKLYAQVEDALHYAVTDRLTREMISAIKAGTPFDVGKLHFEDGTVQKKKLFSGKLVVPLSELTYSVQNGYLVLRNQQGKSVASLGLLNVWNSVVLYHALEAIS